MKKIIIGTAIASLLAIASPVFAQSTVTGTLSSNGNNTTNSSPSVTGNVGSGNSLSGTVTAPSTTGGGTTGAIGNGPPAGGVSGGGSGQVIVCPNLPNNQFSLPAGYEVLNGKCVPIPGNGSGTSVTPSAPNTGVSGTSTDPGCPEHG